MIGIIGCGFGLKYMDSGLGGCQETSEQGYEGLCILKLTSLIGLGGETSRRTGSEIVSETGDSRGPFDSVPNSRGAPKVGVGQEITAE